MAVLAGQVIDAGLAWSAVTVDCFDSDAWKLKAAAAKFGNQFWSVAASGLAVDLFAGKRTAKGGCNDSKVARVVGAKLAAV